MISLANLRAVLFLAVALCLCSTSNNLASAQRALTTLNELYEAGKTLESAQLQVVELAGANRGGAASSSSSEDRNKLLFLFVREPKSDAGNRHFDQVKEVTEQYRIRALNFIAEGQKQQGWFGNIMRTMGPINGLRSISKNYPYLREATERYVQHEKVDKLSEADIECDLAQFQIEALNKILFVLQTEIKYLATEQTALVNTAIFRQLQESRFVASNNFYSLKELTPSQRQLLKNFFLDRVDQEAVTVGTAVDHFEDPTSFVLGRLHDSCHSLLVHTDTWAELETKREDQCANSKLASMSNTVFPYQLEDYELPAAFCRPFLDSL